jgi:hypothetical protein
MLLYTHKPNSNLTDSAITSFADTQTKSLTFVYIRNKKQFKNR